MGTFCSLIALNQNRNVKGQITNEKVIRIYAEFQVKTAISTKKNMTDFGFDPGKDEDNVGQSEI